MPDEFIGPLRYLAETAVPGPVAGKRVYSMQWNIFLCSDHCERCHVQHIPARFGIIFSPFGAPASPDSSLVTTRDPSLQQLTRLSLLLASKVYRHANRHPHGRRIPSSDVEELR